MNRSSSDQMEVSDLRDRIVRSLREQGFRVENGTILPPEDLSKERVRKLHEQAVSHRIELARGSLIRLENDLLRHIACGHEVLPSRVSPRLVEVLPGSREELLFRYVSLHWSIPVSSGYGRRMRFLVVDDFNGKLIGVIGLGDPVFSLGPRDRWIGWTPSDRKIRLRHVMDAFVLGAVPPYSFLLCGKLVAMLAASDTIRAAFEKKYAGARSVIQGNIHDGRLALITTTSALGRSSVYNRLRFKGRLLYQSVGFTRGFGEFHFSNGLYEAIFQFVEKNFKPTAKQERWGRGFRNRREVVKKGLRAIGLSGDFLYHGINREVFVIPLAQNAREFLRGEHAHLFWYYYSKDDMFEYFRDRWMLRRAAWDNRYKVFDRESFRLWKQS